MFQMRSWPLKLNNLGEAPAVMNKDWDLSHQFCDYWVTETLAYNLEIVKDKMFASYKNSYVEALTPNV